MSSTTVITPEQPKELMVLSGAVPTFTLTVLPDALTLKVEALAKGKSITAVESEAEQTAATLAMQVLKGLVDTMETTRESVKKPVLDAGRSIDAKAKEYKKELEAELERIKKLVGGYQLALRRAADAAAAEAARAAAAAREATLQAEALKAEEQRIATEIAQSGGKQKAALEAHLETVRTERFGVEMEVMEAEEIAATAPVAAQKAQGALIAPTFTIEVTDIKALYAAYPMAVKMEANLLILKDMVGRQGLRDIPGVKLTPTVQVRVSGVAPALALQ